MTDDFLDRPTTRAGTLGERIARRLLEAKNYMVYTPDELDGAHPIDIVAINKDRLVALLCDVKAKPRRVHWPDTGIDMRHWLKYQCLGITHNVRVFLIFVDWEAGEVYGGFLDELERQREVKTGKGRFWYPRTENYGRSEIRYFPLAAAISSNYRAGTKPTTAANNCRCCTMVPRTWRARSAKDSARSANAWLTAGQGGNRNE
jgi:hypothetical protein